MSIDLNEKERRVLLFFGMRPQCAEDDVGGRYATRNIPRNHVPRILKKLERYKFLGSHTKTDYRNTQNMIRVSMGRKPTSETVYYLTGKGKQKVKELKKSGVSLR